MSLKTDFSQIDPDLLQKTVAALHSDLELTHKAHLVLINKAFGLPEDADPNHTYSHRTGTYGDYSHFYEDKAGNYWKYTNAPGDHIHHDPMRGTPMIDPNQPMPHTAPEYFTQDGKKRHAAIPPGASASLNPSYHPDDPANTWYESYTDPLTGDLKYTYLDRDVQNNPDLHIQYQLRVVDSNILKYRQYAAYSFQQPHSRDKLVGLLLFLLDQAFYSADHLLNATVGDLVFIGKTIRLLDRKFNCDDELYHFLVQLRSNRGKDEPLFITDTVHGKRPIGARFLASVLKTVGVSPRFLLYWHATQMYSEIFHRLYDIADPEIDDLDQAALTELSNYLNTDEDVRHLVDGRVRKVLSQAVEKSIKHVNADDLGIPYVRSDLVERTPNELMFSKWLHSQPFHVENLPDPGEVAPEDSDVEKSIKLTVLYPTEGGKLPSHVNALYSSPQVTCLQTAAKIYGTNAKVSCWIKAQELSGPKLGKWKAGVKEDAIEKSLLANTAFTPVGGESVDVVFARIKDYFNGILSKANPGDHICLVVDRIPYLLLHAAALGYPTSKDAVQQLVAEPGSKSEFLVDKSTQQFKVLTINAKV